MSTDDGAADFVRLFQTAAQNGGDRFRRNEIVGHTHDVERSERTAAHGKDVGERVSRGDLAVGERVVDDSG